MFRYFERLFEKTACFRHLQSFFGGFLGLLRDCDQRFRTNKNTAASAKMIRTKSEKPTTKMVVSFSAGIWTYYHRAGIRHTKSSRSKQPLNRQLVGRTRSSRAWQRLQYGVALQQPVNAPIPVLNMAAWPQAKVERAWTAPLSNAYGPGEPTGKEPVCKG